MINRPNTAAARAARHQRVRGKISGTPERPRLCVFRSENHIYAQIIDDVAGNTLVAASSVEKGFEGISAVVQNNSAAAEETSATSEELSAQAVALKGMVERFQLRED